MDRKLFRLFRAWVVFGLALIGLGVTAGCESHTSSQHCSSAVSDIRQFDGHEDDYLAHVGVRTWNSTRTVGYDYCTIRNPNGHYHYVTVNVITEEKRWG